MTAYSFEFPLILASRSPRRADILRQVGIPFEVVASAVKEPQWVAGMSDPGKFVETAATVKMQSVTHIRPNRLVVGADTLVVLDGVALGKPKDADEAVQMLLTLSGRTHKVYTGIAVGYRPGGQSAATGVVPTANQMRTEERRARDALLSGHAVTRVTFSEISLREAQAYVSTGEALDKAGAYGIQGKGGCFVDRVEGCYFNVVGLPISLLMSLLKKLDVDVTRFWKNE